LIKTSNKCREKLGTNVEILTSKLIKIMKIVKIKTNDMVKLIHIRVSANTLILVYLIIKKTRE